MLKRLKGLWGSIKSRLFPSKSEWAPWKGQGFFGIPLERQIIKRTKYKPGESYRVGDVTVTVHATKEDMLAAIAKVDAKREAKHAALREKAIDIMMMTPEQLEQFQLDEWLSKRKKSHATIHRILGRLLPKYDEQLKKAIVKYEQVPPSGEAKPTIETTKASDKVKA